MNWHEMMTMIMTFFNSTRTSLTLAVLTGLTGFLLQLFLLPAPSTALTFDQGIALPSPCQYVVKSRSVNCSRRGLTKIPTDIPLDTRRLSLSYNLIELILNDSLGLLPKLEFLSLQHSRIRLIDAGAFTGLPQLQTINLIGNNLTRIPTQVFRHNIRLTDLFLNNNRFQSMPSLDLRRHSSLQSIDLSDNFISSAKFIITLASGCNLTYVALAGNEIQIIDEGDLENLRSANSVKMLDFSDNSVYRVHSASFQSVHVEGLQLQRNPLSQAGASELFDGVENSSYITFLGLSQIKLGGVTQSIFAPLQGSLVTHLSLSTSNIPHLPDNVFSYLTTVEVLSLNKNPLKTISFVAFTNMTSATILYVASCRISQLMTPQTTGTLMPQLSSLYLSNNNLVEIPPRAFVGLPKLFYLDLSFNVIRYIDSDAFSGLEQLAHILLQYNNLINAFSVSVFHHLSALIVLDVSYSSMSGLDPARSFSGLSTLEELFLAGNPLHASDLWDAEKNISVFRGMFNLRVLDLSGISIKGSIPSWGFDGLSQLRQLYLQEVGLVKLPAELFKSLLNLDTLSLDDNNLEELPNFIFKNTPRLSSLYLSRNQLSGLPPLLFRNATNLYQLDLTRTRIGVIPEQVFSPILGSITSIDLSYNALSCGCLNKWLRNWVHDNYDKVFLSDTVCSDNSPAELIGHKFIDFQPTLVCGPRVLLYAGITIPGVIIIFIGIIMYHNRWWIKYKLFLLKLCIIGYREIIDDGEYRYDINIVFHDDDEEWVIDRMVPVVREKFPEAILCVGDDDLRVGLLRLDAVAEVIDNSYKSVFIISYAAIENSWYLTKLRLALQHMNHSQRDAILLVFLENIADDRLPYVVRLLLGVNRPFLCWSSDIRYEEYFWDHFFRCVNRTAILDITLPI